jgi:hypothetical protein
MMFVIYNYEKIIQHNMKKLIAIAVLVMMSMFLTSFIKSDRNTNSMENCIMLPEIVVTYDTVKCKCEVTINHRQVMSRRGMEFGERGRMNPMMGRGQMNHRPMGMQGDTAKFGRGQMMGQRGMNMRMMNPRMEQMMKEHRQMMFKGDTTKFERPMRMNHR